MHNAVRSIEDFSVLVHCWFCSKTVRQYIYILYTGDSASKESQSARTRYGHQSVPRRFSQCHIYIHRRFYCKAFESHVYPVAERKLSNSVIGWSYIRSRRMESVQQFVLDTAWLGIVVARREMGFRHWWLAVLLIGVALAASVPREAELFTSLAVNTPTPPLPWTMSSVSLSVCVSVSVSPSPALCYFLSWSFAYRMSLFVRCKTKARCAENLHV